MLRAAIIGLGTISQSHIKAIINSGLAELTTACDINPVRRQVISQSIPFYTDYLEMLYREQPDVVHICLPHNLHVPVTEAAAMSGRHVMLEKPLARTVQEAMKLLTLEEQCGVHIGVCFQNRCNHTVEELLRLLHDGKHGKVIGLRGIVNWYRSPQYYGDSSWRGSMELAGGGCLINQAIHTLDLIQLLADSPAIQVRGNVGNLLDYTDGIEDTSTARIEFESGAIGLLVASNACFEDLPVQIDVQCEFARFQIRDGTLYQYQNGNIRQIASDTAAETGKEYYGSGHTELIRRFYQVLLGEQDRYICPQDAIESLYLIEAIQKSAQSGKKVAIKKS